jgi:hypothetical protein
MHARYGVGIRNSVSRVWSTEGQSMPRYRRGGVRVSLPATRNMQGSAARPSDVDCDLFPICQVSTRRGPAKYAARDGRT